MTKSIYTLVGMQYRGAKHIVAAMKGGEVLELRRAPANPHDSNAVEVWYQDRHVAFIRSTEAKGLSRTMDFSGRVIVQGKFVVTADRWPQVELNL